MKLIRLYIAAFGGLRQYALDFEAGLTVIQEENGFGKSTLAEFIRAMFYGFPRKTRTLGKRQKYLPWSGEKCGGNLEFEYQGTRYRIERTFGATPKSDTFKLLEAETNRPSSRFSESIGLELFGLDSDSFERSAYLPQNSLALSLTTDSIRAKLSGLVEDAGDVGNFEKAVKALRDKRSGYANYRGVGGSAAELLDQISRIQIQIDRDRQRAEELPQVQTRLVQLEALREGCQEELAQVRAQIGRASRQAALKAVHDQYRRLAAEEVRALEELNRHQGRYPKGYPASGHLAEARENCQRITALKADIRAAEEEAERTAYQETGPHGFGRGVPTREELDGYRGKSSALLTLLARAESKDLTPEEQQELSRLQRLQDAGRLEKEYLDGLGEKCRELEWMRSAPPPAKKPSPVLPIVLMTLSIVAVVLGILLLVNGSYLAGSIAAGLGALTLILGVFLGLRSMISRELRRGPLPEEPEKLAQYLDGALGQDHHRGLQALYAQRQRYWELKERQERAAGERAGLLAQAEALRREVGAFLDRFGMTAGGPEGYHRALDDLGRAAEEYTRMRKQRELLTERRSRAQAELAHTQAELKAFFDRYGQQPGQDAQAQLDQMGQDALLDRSLRQRHQQARDAVERCRADHGQELATAVEELPDLAGLEGQEAEKTRLLDELHEGLLKERRRQEELQTLRDGLPELEDELARLQEQKQEEMGRVKLLDDTLGYLQQAKDSLATSYMGPIRAGFDRYLTRLTDTREGRVLIDPDLTLQPERQGQARELGYFSAGQADLLMLCMRLALVDALFRGEKPFVILDDPFVNLDDRRTAAALALLRELSRERQILYLVCSSSRAGL